MVWARVQYGLVNWWANTIKPGVGRAMDGVLRAETHKPPKANGGIRREHK
jgi:hypothetical protein